MYNNPNPIKIENPEQIKQACAGQLKLRGRPCLVIPSVTVDENLRVKPSDKTIKQCLEAMAGSGLFYRWSTGLGGLDRLVKIDSKGIPQWLAEWQRFRDEIQNFFILVNFAPDGTLVQRLYLTGFETMAFAGGAIHGKLLPRLTNNDLAALRIKFAEPVRPAVVVNKPVDPAVLANEKYLNS
jgi:hypothetical protein